MRQRSVPTRSLTRARNGPAAFAYFYQQHARGLLLFFVRRTFAVEVARDLAAETFAQALEHRRGFRGSTDAEAAGWLYGIAKHQLNRYIRKGVVDRKAITRLGIALSPVGEADYERIIELAGLSDMRQQVAAAFSTLAPDQRRALQLRVIDQRAYPDVALMLGVSEPAARARVSRALRRLLDAVEGSPRPETTS